MTTTLRLHEVARLLGVTAKILMAELSRHGIDVKTHMVVADDKILTALEKKYPSLREKLANRAPDADGASDTEDAAPKIKKARTPKAAGSKVVTKSSAAAKKASKAAAAVEEEVDDVDAPKSIELVQREEGNLGTVTLEQKVLRDGVLRRRRVEAPVAIPEVEEVSAPATEDSYAEESAESADAEVAQPEEERPAARRVIEQKSILRRVAPTPLPPTAASVATKGVTPQADITGEPLEGTIADTLPDEVAEAPEQVFTKSPQKVTTPAAAPAAPTPTAASTVAAGSTLTRPQGSPVITRPRSFAIPAATGRNLSAPSRLKIVDAPLIPPTTPGTRTSGGTGAVGTRPGDARRPLPGRPALVTTATTTDETDADKRLGLAAKKKAATPKAAETPERVTKRDLLGMMEEVEIQRPTGRRSKRPIQKIERRSTQITTPGASKRKIRIEDEITVADLADRVGAKAAEVIRKLISMGTMATMHHVLDFDTASVIASEYGYEVQNVAETAASIIATDFGEDEGAQTHRAPIVTVMGHVDHGKTSLLDYIRKARVVAGEAGGITQHIGAYQVKHGDKQITFIDTPGHAAFTAMRARGASLTDIVILVVAADEGTKPQTLEALAHAQAAKVPIIVAINKMDKPEANPEKVIQELSHHQLVPEEWGGETMYVRVSAHTGEGIPNLLERILIQAEVLDLKANTERTARGIIIESRLDKGKGPVATVIVQTGTLKVGAPIVSGFTFGKVRAMFDDSGRNITEAGPSKPIEILGFDEVPAAGETVVEVSEDAVARKASELTQVAKKRADNLKNSRMSLEDMYKKMQAGDVSELRVVLKGDVQGSVEAVADSLEKIKHDKVKVSVLYKAVGGVTESDVDLAAASGALILGFNVRPTAQAKAKATHEGVQIKTYEIIYELLDEVKLAMQGLLAPILKENVVGSAEVREVFTVSKVGPVAGCFVKSGKITRNSQGRVIRDSVVVYTSKLIGLRRFKDDAKEVLEGFECGIRLENFTDLKPGDTIECFETVEIKQAVG